MNIEKSLSQAQTFAELLPIAQRAHAEVSFLGARYVHVNGYEGSLSLDALTIKVKELVRKDFEFDESERACGKEIASLIDRIYVNSDRALKDSCILTRLFNCIRVSFANIFIYRCQPPMTRYLWEDSGSLTFELYTESQYRAVFKKPPHPGRADCFISNCPDRWYVPDSRREYI